MATKDKGLKCHKRQHLPAKKRSSTKLLQTAFLAAFADSNFNISEACRQIKIDRRTFYRWHKTSTFRQQLDDVMQSRIDLAESALVRNIQSGDTASIIFFLKTIGKSRGYIEAEKVKTGEAPARKAIEILDLLISGSIDAIEAALRFSREGLPLPEALKLLLAKVMPPEPPLELPPEISEEELEARYLAGLQHGQQQQEVFVPARRAEIQQIKDELKNADSWGPSGDGSPKNNERS